MNKGKKTNVKPFMVKNYLSVFINCMIENPAFDSQVGITYVRHEKCLSKQPMLDTFAASLLLQKALCLLSYQRLPSGCQ